MIIHVLEVCNKRNKSHAQLILTFHILHTNFFPLNILICSRELISWFIHKYMYGYDKPEYKSLIERNMHTSPSVKKKLAESRLSHVHIPPDLPRTKYRSPDLTKGIIYALFSIMICITITLYQYVLIFFNYSPKFRLNFAINFTHGA